MRQQSERKVLVKRLQCEKQNSQSEEADAERHEGCPLIKLQNQASRNLHAAEKEVVVMVMEHNG
jgi:hypothetical protein